MPSSLALYLTPASGWPNLREITRVGVSCRANLLNSLISSAVQRLPEFLSDITLARGSGRAALRALRPASRCAPGSLGRTAPVGRGLARCSLRHSVHQHNFLRYSARNVDAYRRFCGVGSCSRREQRLSGAVRFINQTDDQLAFRRLAVTLILKHGHRRANQGTGPQLWRKRRRTFFLRGNAGGCERG